MSLFGNNAFGTSSQPTLNVNTNTGGFGANTQKPAGSIFGNSFGQQQQQQQQQPAPTSSIFGAPANQTSTGGLFGQPAQGTGLFGQTNQQQQQQPSTSGSIFGQPAAQNTTPAPTGGLFGQPAAGTSTGLFGNKSTTPATGGLFGNTNNNATASGSQTGGLFGQPAQQQQQPGSNVFGSLSGGNIFGQSTSALGGGGLFGNTAQQSTNNAPAAGGLFGQSTNGGLFNNQAAKPATGGLFGGLSQSTNNTSATPFGQSTLGLSSLGKSVAPQGTAASAAVAQQNQAAELEAQIQSIAMAWNSQSPQCRFQHYFYNLVDPSTVQQYGRPANATDEAAWTRAQRENPDPSCLVPTLAIGFDDVRDRVQAQSQISNAHQEKSKELAKRIQELSSHHALNHAPRLLRAAAHHIQIMQRLVRLVQHLHLLIPSVRSSAIRPEEEALRVVLEALQEEIKRGAGIKGRVNELWARAGAVAAARERSGNESAGEWRVVDEDGFAQITKILLEQQTGLQHLTKLLRDNQRNIAIIEGTEVKVEHSAAAEGAFATSTSQLRASMLR